MDNQEVMDIAYDLEAEGVYGPNDETMTAEQIAPVVEALREKDISLTGYWGDTGELSD